MSQVPPSNSPFESAYTEVLTEKLALLDAIRTVKAEVGQFTEKTRKAKIVIDLYTEKKQSLEAEIATFQLKF